MLGGDLPLEDRPLDHELVPVGEEFGVAFPAEDRAGHDRQPQDEPDEARRDDAPGPLPAEVREEKERRDLAGDGEPEHKPRGRSRDRGDRAPGTGRCRNRMKMLTLLCDRSPVIAGSARMMAAALTPSGSGSPDETRRNVHTAASTAMSTLAKNHVIAPDDGRQFGERPQDDRHYRRVGILVLADVGVRPREDVEDHRPPAEERGARLPSMFGGFGDLGGVLETRSPGG